MVYNISGYKMDKIGHSGKHYIATPPINEDACRTYLKEHRWPIGLQDECIKSMAECSMRYFIVDDSGSMVRFV